MFRVRIIGGEAPGVKHEENAVPPERQRRSAQPLTQALPAW